MKIVVTAGGIIWNESHPALQKYGSDVIIVRRTPDAEADLIARVGADRNVFVLTDNDPRSFLPLQALTRSFRSRRVHLFVCLPFTYESSRRKKEILELLKDFSVVKSLCLVELDTFLNGMGKDETLGGLQLRIRNDMIGLIDKAVPAMDGLDDFKRYRFDFASGTYLESDFSVLPEEFTEKLLTKKKTVAEKEETETGDDSEETKEAADLENPEALTEESQTTVAEASAEELPAESPAEGSGEQAAEETSAASTEPAAEAKPEKKKRRSLFAFLSRRKD